MTQWPERTTRQLTALSGPLCAVIFIGGLAATGLLVPDSAPPNLPSSAPTDIQRYFLNYGGIALLRALRDVVVAVLLVVFSCVAAASLLRRTTQLAG